MGYWWGAYRVYEIHTFLTKAALAALYGNMDEVLKQKGFKIFHLNIRSLTPKLDQLRVLIENKNIDIFSISETWLHSGISSHILSIPGYAFERYDRETKLNEHLVKCGGGLGVYYNPNLSCDSEIFSDKNISNKDIELQVLQFKRKNAKNIVLLNLYRPPNGDAEVAIDYLNDVILAIPHAQRKDIVVLRDFNIDMLDRNSPDAKSLKYFGSINGLKQLIDSPTRCTLTSNKIIDLIFSNMDYISNHGTLDVFISDHQPIFLIKKKPFIKQEKNCFSGQTYRNYTQQIMHDCFDIIIDKNRILNENDPSTCWNYLFDDITKLADMITPKKDYIVKLNKPAWLTHDLLNMQKDRDYLYRKAKRTKTQHDWRVARDHRNRVNIAIRNAKATLIKDELTTNKTNPKKFWRSIHKDILPEKLT